MNICHQSEHFNKIFLRSVAHLLLKIQAGHNFKYFKTVSNIYGNKIVVFQKNLYALPVDDIQRQKDVAEFCGDLWTMWVENSSLICARSVSIHLKEST